MFENIRKNLKNLLIIGAFLLSVASIVISVFGVVHSQSRTVSFDIKGTVQTFIEQTSRLGLSEDQQTAVGKKFDEAMGQALRGYVKENKATVLVSGAVVDGARDITGKIREEIARIMHQRENE